MYMTENLTDENGELFPMAGIFPVSVKMKKRLSRLGYRKVNMRTDCCLGESGHVFYGHEFHYSDIVERGDALEHLYTFEDGRGEGCIQGNALGSYIHLHFSRAVEHLDRMHNLLRVK
jgi:cobyrinic acid a,c-diamide synthase